MAPPLDFANLPDADVVALAQQGREAAFRELLRRYERPVFSLIFRMVRDRETAEDLAQDTFIKVLNHIDRYRPEFRLSSWLFKIANNVAIDHLRRRQVETISMDGSPHAATAAEVEATSLDIAARQETALEELENREMGSAIERAIAALRPEYRSCILLRHVEGRSYEEIAATLDLPLGTVKTYIHRARHQLREALEGVREGSTGGGEHQEAGGHGRGPAAPTGSGSSPGGTGDPSRGSAAGSAAPRPRGRNPDP